MQKVLFTMEEVAEVSAQSRSAVYADSKAGLLCSVKIGKLRRVTREQLQDYLRAITGTAIELVD